MEETKEFQNIFKAIRDWTKSENNNVAFIGSFLDFDKEDEVKQDKLIGYGEKQVLKIELEEINKMIKKERDKFINW